jgi:glycosyltransferase involved in cell wall biosynthesis
MNSNSNTVTIGIATYNRSKFLVQTVKSVLSQNCDFVLEIIIVDQTPDIQITNDLNLYFQKLNKSIRYYVQQRPAVSLARNTIISYAKGDIILFFDDDVILGKNSIASHLSVYKNENVKSCIGHIHHRKFSVDLELLDIDDPRKGTDSIMEDDAVLDLNYKGVSISCNQSFEKNALLKIGGFDENFIGGYYEDADIGLRFKKEGFQIAFHPNAMVLHLRAPQGGLRFESSQPFTEVERLLSFVLFYVRYPKEYGFRKSMWTILRAGPLRKPNILNPIKHFLSWINLLKAFKISFEIKDKVKSILY